MKKLTGLMMLVLVFTAFTIAQAQTVPLLEDWKFTLTNPAGAEKTNFDASDWETVDVPHDWSILTPYDRNSKAGGQGGYLGTGTGWYRKSIDIKDLSSDDIYLIYFDAAFMNSTVWVNGEVAGKCPYGYISFYFDITDKLKQGKNTIAVRLKNEPAPNARWYPGCGIYGDVTLIVKNRVSFDQWGVFVTTPKITKAKATVNVQSAVNNGTSKPVDAIVVSSVVDAKGVTAASARRQVKLKANQQLVVDSGMDVATPSLWSVDSPYLYTLVSKVMVGDKVVHTEETKFGIRSIEFNAKQGFLLNSVPTKLKGVSEHSDGGLVGSAIPEQVLRRRLQILKDMGCNAIRVSHNPRRPLFYRLCDEMGIMVMDEIFDGWGPKISFDYGKLFFKDWWKADVRDWVKRDRNHPSVIMYSIGNETGIYDKHGISDEVKKYDTTRPTTGGSLLYGVDIPGFNAPGANPGVLEKFHSENPDKPVALTEVPHTLQTRGFYRVMNWWRSGSNLKNYFEPYGDKQIFFDGHQRYSSSYDNAGVRICARTSWKRTKETPWILGEFRWTGFDYLGEASFGGGKWPARIWNFGIIDLCGFPKDHYYFYQSQWTEKPMVHILPHWTHPGMEGTVIPVVGYSNCDEVELFLNGKSLGKKVQSDMLDFVWKVPYSPGTLKAVGYRGGKAVAEKVFRTAGVASVIELTIDKFLNTRAKNDITHLTTTIKDNKGEFVPWACNRIEYKIEGPVKLLGFDNGDPLDVTTHRQTYRKVFNGLSLGIFESAGEKGYVRIAAAGILGKTRFEDKTTVAIAVNDIVLNGAKTIYTNFEIFYSTDGSEPVKYAGPFELNKSAEVTATIKKNGKEFMTVSEKFVKGPLEKVSDRRFKNPEPMVQKTVLGPAAEQVVGEYFVYKQKKGESTNRIKVEVDRKKKFVFTETGSTFTVANGEKRLFGYYTYDYPANPKNKADVGEGIMFMFVTDGLFNLKFDPNDPDKLMMKSRWRTINLKRAK